MEWPIFFRDSLKTGNKDSNVAICTLWTEKKKILKNVSDEKYNICGNLYNANGINYIIKNVLANPLIRYIVLCGRDLRFSGEAFANFMRNGIDEKGSIIGGFGNIDMNIGKENIEKFRENVELIDMRGKEGEIESRINELKRREAFMEPVVIGEVEERQTRIDSDGGCFAVKENTISRAWLRMIDIIMKYGEEKDTEYGIKQKEVLNIITVIDEEKTTMAPWLNISDEDLKKYYPKVLTGEKIGDVNYTYGERLFNHPMSNINEQWKKETDITFNQVENAIEHLKKVPYTRRAIAFTWNVALDSKSDSAPCITQVSWNISNGKLYQTVIIRSSDTFGGWPMNVFALRELQRRVAKEVGIKIGSLTVVSNSAHVYENNWIECENIIKKHYTGGRMEMELEKSGYFIIFLEGKEIVAQHYLPEGRKTKFVFRGGSASEIYRRILHENLVNRMDHAAYLGMELTKAETALKEGKEYRQDM